MITVPNVISLLRIPLAFLFCSSLVSLRLLAIVLAILTDGLDGFIARRYKLTSRSGTFLDPLSDRFFVFFAVIVLSIEGHLGLFEIVALASRDIAIFLFSLYLYLKGTIHSFWLRALWMGKVTTVLQLFVLTAITVHIAVPVMVYYLFVALGLFTLIELLFSDPSQIEAK